MNETFTITFGDKAENHKGMQMIGEGFQNGFSIDYLKQIQTMFQNSGCQCDFIDLNQLVEGGDPAAVLICRSGLNFLIENGADLLWEELINLNWDQQALMYGRVVHKKARWNLCFGDKDQEPDYKAGKGRIFSWDQIPVLSSTKIILEQTLGLPNLVAEGNRYYDLKKCGIGFHGDGERKLVIGIRIGATLPLDYQWHFKGERIGERAHLLLNHGDIYFMSEKAVGQDWKKRNILTLRHAAGADKYLN